MPMGLKSAAVWRKLATLLGYHQTLVVENKQKARMARTARKIRRLTYLLEQYNKTGKHQQMPTSGD